MITYQEFITEIKRYRLRRSGGDPFTHYSDGKQKPLDLSAIHAAGNADAKASVGYKEKRLKQYRRQETARRMDAAGKKLGLPEEIELGEALDKKFDSMRSRGGKSAPPEERSVGGERNRSNKDYWADTLGKNRDRGKGSKAKRRAAALGEDNVQELFITKLTPEQKRKKQVETLIRLMKHAKDPSADVAKPKKEDYDLSETSLTRVMSKSKKGGMAIMSAQRGDKSKTENKERSKQLERDVRGAGLPGPTKVAGRYTENPGTPDEKKVGEKSHIITPGKKGKRKFKKAIEKLGKKYNQDSVLIQRKPGGSSTLKGTSKTSWPGQGKNVKIGSMKPGRTGEFDTKVKNKTFTVEH